MDKSRANPIVRGFHACLLVVLGSAVLGCVEAAPTATESQEIVGCLLPGQIRQLDESVTYLSERRPVRTTKADCIRRGGTVQPVDRLPENESTIGK